MKSSEMLGMSDDQLRTTLAETEKHLFQLRFQSATDRLETPGEMAKAKKDIARIKTEQRRREIVAIKATSADAIPTLLADLHTKTEGPGKRRVKRSIARLEAVRVRVIETVQASPAKGK